MSNWNAPRFPSARGTSPALFSTGRRPARTYALTLRTDLRIENFWVVNGYVRIGEAKLRGGLQFSRFSISSVNRLALIFQGAQIWRQPLAIGYQFRTTTVLATLSTAKMLVVVYKLIAWISVLGHCDLVWLVETGRSRLRLKVLAAPGFGRLYVSSAIRVIVRNCWSQR